MIDDQRTEQTPPEPRYDLLFALLWCAFMHMSQERVVESVPPDQQEPPLFEDQTTTYQDAPFADEPITQPLGQRKQRRSLLSLVVILLLAALLVYQNIPLLSSVVLRVFAPEKAEVTLFTSEKAVHERYTFLAVTGIADPNAHQVSSRLLQYTTPPQQVTVTATGTAHTQPTPAYGSVILYNDAPYSQTVVAGTVMQGNSGVEIITDQTVTIAAGTGQTNGSATTSAHTLQAGTAANIPAYDINRLCCLSGIRAMNVSSFTGGHDPISFTVVSQTDVDQATKKASLTLDPLAKDTLMISEKPAEQTLTPINCSVSIQATPAVGAKATRTAVSIQESCTVQVYDAAMLQSVTRSQFMQNVTAHSGAGYTPKQEVSVELAKPTLLDSTHHTYTIPVTVRGTIIYHPTPAQVHQLTLSIAGKPIALARTILLTNAGIEGVYVKTSDNSTTLPTDPGQIHVTVS